MDFTKVYIADTKKLNDNKVYSRFYHMLSDQRRKKADKYANKSDKLLCVGAWMLLKYALKKEGIENFSVIYGEKGKPYLKGRNDIFFNLSHSQNYVMCTVSTKEAGCDIQNIKPVNFSVCERFFTCDETEYIKAQKTDEEKAAAYTGLWTLKESYAKLIGDGLELGAVEKIKIPDRNVYFKGFDVIEGYKCSVCYQTDTISDIETFDITKKDC